MHGIFNAFGYSILISFAAALLLSLIADLKPVKCALVVASVLLLIALAVLLMESGSLGGVVMDLIIVSTVVTLGGIGSLPGAVLGRRMRSAFLGREF